MFESRAEPEAEPPNGLQKVKATRTKQAKRKPSKAPGKILDSHGEAPEQYPNADW